MSAIKDVYLKFIKIYIISSFERACAVEIIKQLNKEIVYTSISEYIKYHIEENIGIHLYNGLSKLMVLFIDDDKFKHAVSQCKMLEYLLHSENKKLKELTKEIYKNNAYVIDCIKNKDIMFDYDNSIHLRLLIETINNELLKFILSRHNKISALVDSKLCDMKFDDEKKNKRRDICKLYKRYDQLLDPIIYSRLYNPYTDEICLIYYLCMLYSITLSLEEINHDTITPFDFQSFLDR